MSLRIVVDEDLPKSLAKYLREKGITIFDVREVGLRGSSDEKVLEFAISKKALVITGDVGFGSVKRFQGNHYGILVARIPQNIPIKQQIEMIWACLQALSEQELINSIIICEPGRVRIRKVPK